jgi:phosphatidylinositol-3-phosphatase
MSELKRFSRLMAIVVRLGFIAAAAALIVGGYTLATAGARPPDWCQKHPTHCQTTSSTSTTGTTTTTTSTTTTTTTTPAPGETFHAGAAGTGQAFVDQGGNSVKLNGFDQQPVWSGGMTESASLARLQQAKSAGFNSMRYILFWNLMEPTKGSFAHLADLDQAVANAKQAGVYVILEMVDASQDMAHIPGWAQTGADTIADINANAQGYITALAQRYADDSTVVAYDPVNEPLQRTADNTRDLGMYQTILSWIRPLDADKIVQIEPTWGSSSLGSGCADWSVLKLKSNVEIQVHDYYGGGGTGGIGWNGCVNDGTQMYNASAAYTGTESALDQHLKRYLSDAGFGGLPLYVGEYSDETGQSGHDQWIQDTATALDNNGLSRSWWEYHTTNPNSATDSSWNWMPWAPLLTGGSPPPPPPTTSTTTTTTLAPDTSITSGPSGSVSSSSATFSFTSTAGGSTFQCKLDAGAFTACTSPKSYTGLANGSHTFQVAATSGGNTDPTPASRTWTVDTVAPAAPTNFMATGATQTTIATSWKASTDVGVAGYNVYVNGTKLNVPLVTGTTYTFTTGLTCGTSYTLGVAAVDAAGNVSARTTMTASTSACSSSGYQRVVWVVMENHSYEQIIGNVTSAWYINQLAGLYGSATQMFAESHPSLPNYIAMTSGSTQGITDDSGPGSHLLTVPNIFTQLGAQARSLEESMPFYCDKSDATPYAVRHNPGAYYVNWSQCGTNDEPLGATPDISAKFTFITPNLCHDMHSNNCSGSSNVILQGDQWLESFIPTLLSTSQYQSGDTAIFLTWDEDSGSNGNHIPTIVITPTVGFRMVGTPFTHYSMLRTTEEILGLPLIGNAGNASTASMCSDFKLC